MIELIQLPVNALSDEQLGNLCVFLNDEYRAGRPAVSDDAFDLVYLKELSVRVPDHPLLTRPQRTESAVAPKGMVKHPSEMLSTLKAYSIDEIETYVNRCIKAGASIGMTASDIRYKVTAKLDGIAGRLASDIQSLYTRGDGEFGNDISHLIRNGLVIKGDGSSDGVGEVVMPLSYFDAHLQEEFSHPRNVISGMASSDNYNEYALKALQDGAVHLVLYKDMPNIECNGETLLADLESMEKTIKDESDYPLDGLVIEVIDENLKNEMGRASNHHHWQVAKKEAGETAVTEIIDEILQIGKTGRITHVFLIKPTRISGCEVRRISGKNARYVKEHGLGKGAELTIIRSGEVVPNHLTTNKPVTANIPDSCPCCGEQTVWKKSPLDGVDTFLVCENISCPAQSQRSIMHHFKTVKIDQFGKATVKQLGDAEYTTIEQIYMMNHEAFVCAGFGSGKAKQLLAEIQRGLNEPVRDNYLLASLGISKLGRGSSEKLLAVYRIDELRGITANQLEAIHGFGDKNSVSISTALNKHADTLDFLMKRFSVVHTQDQEPASEGGSLDGVNIVFTGSMSGNRDEMKKDAKSKGAKVQSGVNGKTQLLCCGENVGAKKLEAAKEKGVEIISESDYWQRYS